ncbi:hypothetical protein LCGC14_2567230 [marine sediment metagenome]|uniref:Uncharacterized protein n=1 Tax=marine sediment metagenome TaxID=412755 RepID=A0A0F9CUD0_9ZZZZ
MKVTEGNYVKYHNEIITVSWEDIREIKRRTIKGLDVIHKPIPLTEEWLVKFGCDKEEHKNGNSFSIRISFRGNASELLTLTNKGSIKEPMWFISITLSWSDKWMPLPTRVDYVHTFQNLYHSLTGKELTYRAKPSNEELKV